MWPRGGLAPKLRTAALTALLFSPFAVNGQTSPPARKEPPVQEITLPEARALAIEALSRGDPLLAHGLAQGLLQADPKSSFAYFTLAQAQKLMGQPTPARRSAAKSYRYADQSLHRFEAARLAAGLAYAEERPTLAQLWVRRAAQNAPNAQTERQLASDYSRLRAENPLSFSMQGGIRPSSNVNNGSDMAVQIIDGLPYIGTLNGAAQALSGLDAHIDGRLGYRLRGTKRSRTTMQARMYVRRVALSSGARALAPTARNSDYGTTFAEIGLHHEFVIGNTGATGQAGLSFGQLWAAGARSYDFTRLALGRNWRLGENTRLTLDGTVELRKSARDPFFDSQVYAVVAGVDHKLRSGDRIGLTLNLRQTESRFFNAGNSSATIRASYGFGRQIGPARISAGLTAEYTDYPDFALVFVVPGGRQDRSLFADMNFFFPDIDYAGFAPNLRISAGRTSSNVSRYETRQFSVSLGIRSKF